VSTASQRQEGHQGFVHTTGIVPRRQLSLALSTTDASIRFCVQLFPGKPLQVVSPFGRKQALLGSDPKGYCQLVDKLSITISQGYQHATVIAEPWARKQTPPEKRQIF
jgi:hypothetical protein